MWEETLVFTVHMPEIALVRFLVWDHDPIGRDFIGQRTLAFSSMMPGEQGAWGCGRDRVTPRERSLQAEQCRWASWKRQNSQDLLAGPTQGLGTFKGRVRVWGEDRLGPW
jgi:hypothetical protein